jgi:hypothetical protein
VNDVLRESEIIYNPTEVNRLGNKYNIDFDYTSEENEELDIIFFNTVLNKELRLRQLPYSGNVEERRTRLKQRLVMEQKLSLIKEAICRTREGKEASLILIKQAIPCIMNCENRGGEKIITMLLSSGANKFQRENRAVTLDHYIERIENIVQTRILGTRTRPKQWRLPLNDRKTEVSLQQEHCILYCCLTVT